MNDYESKNRKQSLFSELIQNNEKTILRLCCVYLRDISMAEDAVQETFIKAY